MLHLEPDNCGNYVVMHCDNSILQDIKNERYNQGFYDGYKKATEQANAIIEDIKADIDNLDTYTIHMGASQLDKVCVEFKEVKRILNNHISGKEQE